MKDRKAGVPALFLPCSFNSLTNLNAIFASKQFFTDDDDLKCHFSLTEKYFFEASLSTSNSKGLRETYTVKKLKFVVWIEFFIFDPNFKNMVLFILLYAVNFIRTLVIIAIIYFGLRIIRRYILPLLIDRGIKNMQQKMQEQQRQQRPQRPEGDVTVETNKQSKHTKDRDNGEYIDFEEVD